MQNQRNKDDTVVFNKHLKANNCEGFMKIVEGLQRESTRFQEQGRRRITSMHTRLQSIDFQCDPSTKMFYLKIFNVIAETELVEYERVCKQFDRRSAIIYCLISQCDQIIHSPSPKADISKIVECQEDKQRKPACQILRYNLQKKLKQLSIQMNLIEALIQSDLTLFTKDKYLQLQSLDQDQRIKRNYRRLIALLSANKQGGYKELSQIKELILSINSINQTIERKEQEIYDLKQYKRHVQAWLQEFEVEQSSWIREIWGTTWNEEHLKKTQTERLVEGCRLIVKTLRQELEEARNQLKKEVQLKKNMQSDLQRVNEEASLLKRENKYQTTQAKMKQGKLRIGTSWNETFLVESETLKSEIKQKESMLKAKFTIIRKCLQKQCISLKQKFLEFSVQVNQKAILNSTAIKQLGQEFGRKCQEIEKSNKLPKKTILSENIFEEQNRRAFRQSSILLDQNTQSAFFANQIQRFFKARLLMTSIVYRYDRFNINFLNYIVETDFPFALIFRSKTGTIFAAFVSTVRKEGGEPSKAFLASLSLRRVFLPSSKRGDTEAVFIESNRLIFGKSEFAVENNREPKLFQARCSFTSFGRRYFDIQNAQTFVGEMERDKVEIAEMQIHSLKFEENSQQNNEEAKY